MVRPRRLLRFRRNADLALRYGPRDWWQARTAIARLGAIQNLSELTSFASFLRGRRLRAVLEVGTAGGGLFWLFCRLASRDAILVSVDLPAERRVSGGRPSDRDVERFARRGQTVRRILGDSHDPAVLAQVREALAGRSVDLLFIDGDHTYEGVELDYRMYSPLVGERGVVAFHDIVASTWHRCEVDRFWQELRREAGPRAMELVDDPSAGWGGIGIVTGRTPRRIARSTASH